MRPTSNVWKAFSRPMAVGVMVATTLLGAAGCDPPPTPTPTPRPTATETPPLDKDLAAIFAMIADRQCGPARILLRRLLDDGDVRPATTFLFGLSYHRQRRYGAAEPFFDTATTLSPTYPPIWHFLGWSRWYLGDVEGATEAWKHHAILDPDEGDTAFALGLAAMERGEVDTADRRFNEALVLQQQRSDRGDGVAKAQIRLAEIAAGRGDLQAARGLLEAALQVTPGYWEGHYRLSVICRRLGDIVAADVAMETFQKVRASEHPGTRFPQ